MKNLGILARAQILFALLGGLTVLMGGSAVFVAAQIKNSVTHMIVQQDRVQELALDMPVRACDVNRALIAH
jgi:hypothetical protein